MLAWGIAWGAMLILAACGSRPPSAPVIERAPAPLGQGGTASARVPMTADTRPENYTVKRGDTLYGIALDHGLDYRELAEWNRLDNPNVIRIGQVLRLRPPPPEAAPVAQARPIAQPGSVEARPLSVPVTPGDPSLRTEPLARKLPYSEENVALLTRPEGGAIAAAKPAPAKPAPAQAEPPRAVETRPAPRIEPQSDDDRIDWAWPAGGRVIAGFSEPGNKGIDIAGRPGDPVLATAAGRVVYSGSGLRGYGKLVIIKHNNTYLSAYAHNREILVKEGQTVARGQRIAELGDTDSDRPKLHFEIRRLGRPVDPAQYLPAR